MKVVARRGCKYPEIVEDSSKFAISVMFAKTGDGKLLFAYTCYKATDLYSTWTENGPERARYNRTPSGWFNMAIFEDWFMAIVVPYFKKLGSPKMLIGDNLCSHIS